MTDDLPRSETDTALQAVRSIRSFFATQQHMAECLNVSQATVSLCLRGTMKLPARCVIKAEEITGISRHLVRPDIYPLDAANLRKTAHFHSGHAANGRLQTPEFKESAVR